MTSATPSPCSCCCCSTTDSDNSNTSLTQTQVPPFMVTTSEFSISIKEIVILGLVFLLFIYSIFSFLHNWKKNYRDISSSCQFNRLAHDNTTGVLPPLAWDETESLTRTESRMSKIVRAKSVMEKSRSRSIQGRPSRLSHPRKSLSTSNLMISRTQLAKLSAQYSLGEGSELESPYFHYSQEDQSVCQKSLPNIVRSPYNNRLKSLSQSESIGSSHLLPLGSREQDKDSFIMDLDPVDEENDEC